MDEDWMTIAEAAAQCGLPESTLRYWERIGLVNRVQRDASSGHRRYRPEDVATLETLGNLRAVGLSIADMRAYLASARRGDEAAGEQRELFETHARRLACEVAALELRRRYLDLKVRYWIRPRARAPAVPVTDVPLRECPRGRPRVPLRPRRRLRVVLRATSRRRASADR